VKVPIDGKGGMILLSTDVNATADRRFRGWITAMFWTVWHRVFVVRLVDRAILRQLKRSGVKIGWSIGPTLYGRYYDPEKDILYSERSFSVEILDAP